jgi:hypothetical protein
MESLAEEVTVAVLAEMRACVRIMAPGMIGGGRRCSLSKRFLIWARREGEVGNALSANHAFLPKRKIFPCILLLLPIAHSPKGRAAVAAPDGLRGFNTRR